MSQKFCNILVTQIQYGSSIGFCRDLGGGEQLTEYASENWLVGWIGFYGISTIVDYLMLNIPNLIIIYMICKHIL